VLPVKRKKLFIDVMVVRKNFCFNHLSDHHRAVVKQLNEIEDKRNLFQQNLIEQKANPENQFVIKQINQ
jgi:hypothetical protein